MPDETKTEPQPTIPPSEELTVVKEYEPNGDSSLFGVSVRGWLAVETVTAAILAVFLIGSAPEPLGTMATLALGFYLGQKRR